MGLQCHKQLHAFLLFRGKRLFDMMDIYRISPKALPRKLYRIDYRDTWSRFLPGTGFQAGTFDPDHHSTTVTTGQPASDLDAFWQSMRDQLNPRSGIRSPFVALYSNRTEAGIWALRWEVKNERACDVVEISGMVLLRLDVPIFHPHTLRFRIPDLCDTQGSEYLCLHSVPEAAIINRSSTSTIPIRKSTYTQKWIVIFIVSKKRMELILSCQHFRFST